MANQKSYLQIKSCRSSVIRTRENQKAILSMKVLWRKANQNTSPHKNTRKDAKNETDHEEPLVEDNPVVEELIYLIY